MLDIKSTNNNMKKKDRCRWFLYLICIPILASIVYMARYPQFKMDAEEQYENPVESEPFIEGLYISNYVLYKDLYEKLHGTRISYRELYLDISPDSGKEYAMEEYLNSHGIYEKTPQDGQAGEKTDENDTEYGNLEETPITPDDDAEYYQPGEIQEKYMSYILDYERSFSREEEDYFENFENHFHDLAQIFDYAIMDEESGIMVTNSGRDLRTPDEFYIYFRVTYDEFGSVSSHCVRGEKSDTFLKRASEVGRTNPVNSLADSLMDDTYLKVMPKGPVSCTIAYGITPENWENVKDKIYYGGDHFYLEASTAYAGTMYYLWDASTERYLLSGLKDYLVLLVAAVAILAFFLPLGEKKPWKHRFFRLPLEAVLMLGFLMLTLQNMFTYQTSRVLSDKMTKAISEQWGIPLKGGLILAYTGNFLFCVFLFFLLMFFVYNLRQLREIGCRAYIKKYCYVYRFFPFLKEKAVRFYDYMMSFDVSTATNKIIIRLLVVNGIIVFLICSLWFFGIIGVLIYSVLLYFILRKYINDLKKKYEILLRATNKIAEGNLNVTIPEYLGIFEPFKPQIDKIQEGFRNAVEEEVKSQRMKTELITNVSHDLKTPLTAIITYVNLLKDENLTDEQRREYVDTLERKSMRLKVLIEDLFEVSKATSRNITLNLMDVDVANLIKQVQLEMEEQLTEAGLSVRLHIPEEKAVVKLDSQKTYRIYENLIGNICKYALHDTRVYIDVTQDEDTVSVVMKNISATELLINPMELTERFVRGDSSRNTEGSGLGLAIAKSFVELQNGKMNLELDGDLFKVTTVWYK